MFFATPMVGADEGDADQHVAGDLLGPGGRVVEHVAGDELVEDRQRQQPEEAEGDPALGDRVGEDDRFVLDVEVAFVIDDLFFVGHAATPGYLMLTMRS